MFAVVFSTVQCQFPGEEENSSEISVSITSPIDGTILAGCIINDMISVDVQSTSEIDSVEFYVNNTLIGTDKDAPYNFQWDPHDFTPESGTVVFLSNLLERFPLMEKIFEHLDPAFINGLLTHLIEKNPNLHKVAETDEAIRIKAIAYDIEGNSAKDSVSVNTGPDSPSCNCSNKLIVCLENITPLNPLSRCLKLAQRCASDCPGEECCQSQCMDSVIEATEYCKNIKDNKEKHICQEELSRLDCNSACGSDDGSGTKKLL